MNVITKVNNAKTAGARRLTLRALPVQFALENAVHIHIATIDRNQSFTRPAARALLPPTLGQGGPAKHFDTATGKSC